MDEKTPTLFESDESLTLHQENVDREIDIKIVSL